MVELVFQIVVCRGPVRHKGTVVSLLNYFRRAFLRFAARRFKAYRALSECEGLIQRSLIIEDKKRGRFFEISYDEIYCGEGIEAIDRTNEGRIIYLSDILICISRMTFDAFLYESKGALKGSYSIEDAIALGFRNRQNFWNRATETIERPESGSESAPSELAPITLTLHQRPFDEAAESPDDLIQRLTRQVAKRVGSKRAYWQLLSKKEEARALQRLTFEGFRE